MNCDGDSMGFFGVFSSLYRWWDRYGLEEACEDVLDEWEQERPEYIAKIRRWIDSGQIPQDDDLQTLCRVYQERLRPRPCYRHAKT